MNKETWWLTTDPDEELFVKRGRRYFPAVKVTGYERFEGFPADGVWLVQTQTSCKAQRLIKRVETEQLLDPSEIQRLAELEQYRDVITRRLARFGKDLSDALFADRQCAYSLNDIADALIAAMLHPESQEALF